MLKRLTFVSFCLAALVAADTTNYITYGVGPSIGPSVTVGHRVSKNHLGWDLNGGAFVNPAYLQGSASGMVF